MLHFFLDYWKHNLRTIQLSTTHVIPFFFIFGLLTSCTLIQISKLVNICLDRKTFFIAAMSGLIKSGNLMAIQIRRIQKFSVSETVIVQIANKSRQFKGRCQRMSNRIAAFIAKKRGGLFCIRAMIYRNCTVCEKSLMAVKLDWLPYWSRFNETCEKNIT